MGSQTPQTLDILSQVQHVGDPCSETDWPSWVPKFNESRSASFMIAGVYTAGTPMEGRLPYFAQLHDCSLHGNAREPDVLQVDGFRIDHVEVVSDVMTSKTAPPCRLRASGANFSVFHSFLDLIWHTLPGSRSWTSPSS